MAVKAGRKGLNKLVREGNTAPAVMAGTSALPAAAGTDLTTGRSAGGHCCAGRAPPCAACPTRFSRACDLS